MKQHVLISIEIADPNHGIGLTSEAPPPISSTTSYMTGMGEVHSV